MHSFLSYLTIAALIATFIVLIMGLATLFLQGKDAHLKSNKFMRWRILLQFAALCLFALLLLLQKKG
ncbi:MAG: hypothetical protein BGO76_06085 [Caedibacter sp. 38-128]|nr:twin transmembrane helix small protein [Holosporales bacterium]OJX08815.1 MAG: hypothetical protein BGO76_06085 [Caedibacter sp. 38-128]